MCIFVLRLVILDANSVASVFRRRRVLAVWAPVMNLKIFQSDQFGEVVVVKPVGEGSAFRYQDLQTEVNAIRSHMMKPGQKHLVVNLETMSYFGSEFIGALVTMLREVKRRGGMACFCCASPQMMKVLNNMALFKLWPHFDELQPALDAAQQHGAA